MLFSVHMLSSTVVVLFHDIAGIVSAHVNQRLKSQHAYIYESYKGYAF